VIRLLPALTMTQAEADEVVAILAPLVKNFLNNPKD
jgi:acetylornithine aminotransferase